MNNLTIVDSKELVRLNKNIQNNLKLVDDIVLKNYISSLTNLEIIPLSDDLKKENINRIWLFNITKMVYKKMKQVHINLQVFLMLLQVQIAL